ncbi:MAG: hypothetical protein ACWGSD_04620 [Thermodesulfobacteriota bacterium]
MEKMKKLLSGLVALSFALSLSAAVLAQSKDDPTKPAKPAKATDSVKKAEAKKEKSHQITGVIEAVDEAAGTLTVKGNKASANLKVSDEVELSKIRVGEKVLVHYRGNTAYSVKKVTAKKASPKKTAKKEKAPAAAPASK